MTSLDFSITFDVPAKVIYNALIDPMEIMQYTRAPCKVEPKEGGEYVILDGRIQGQFQKLEANKEIHLLWKFSEWSSHSNVKITLTEGDDNCTVHVQQTNVPQDVKLLENGWRQQIFVPMSKIRGYAIDDSQ